MRRMPEPVVSSAPSSSAPQDSTEEAYPPKLDQFPPLVFPERCSPSSYLPQSPTKPYPPNSCDICCEVTREYDNSEAGANGTYTKNISHCSLCVEKQKVCKQLDDVIDEELRKSSVDAPTIVDFSRKEKDADVPKRDAEEMVYVDEEIRPEKVEVVVECHTRLDAVRYNVNGEVQKSEDKYAVLDLTEKKDKTAMDDDSMEGSVSLRRKEEDKEEDYVEIDLTTNAEDKAKKCKIVDAIEKGSKSGTDFPVFGKDPEVMICTNCNESILTYTKLEATEKTHCSAFLLAIVCLCFLPYMLDYQKTMNHYCPNCNHYLGTGPLIADKEYIE